jgi:hypothetical protein
MKSNRTKLEVAELIERFLENRLRYPQEWNDFIDCRQKDPDIELYRERCYDLDPLVNHPDPVDGDGIAKLQIMIEDLRTSNRE